MANISPSSEDSHAISVEAREGKKAASAALPPRSTTFSPEGIIKSKYHTEWMEICSKYYDNPHSALSEEIPSTPVPDLPAWHQRDRHLELDDRMLVKEDQQMRMSQSKGCNMNNAGAMCYLTSPLQLLHKIPSFRNLFCSGLSAFPMPGPTGQKDWAQRFEKLYKVISMLSRLFQLLDKDQSRIPEAQTMQAFQALKLINSRLANEYDDTSSVLRPLLEALLQAANQSDPNQSFQSRNRFNELIMQQDAQIKMGLPIPPLDIDHADFRNAIKSAGNESDLWESLTFQVAIESQCPDPGCASPYSRTWIFGQIIDLELPKDDIYRTSVQSLLDTWAVTNLDQDKDDGLQCLCNNSHPKRFQQWKRFTGLPRILLFALSRDRLTSARFTEDGVFEFLELDNDLPILTKLKKKETLTLDMSRWSRDKRLPSENDEGQQRFGPEQSYRYQLTGMIKYIDASEQYICFALVVIGNTRVWMRYDGLEARPRAQDPFDDKTSVEHMLVYTRIDEVADEPEFAVFGSKVNESQPMTISKDENISGDELSGDQMDAEERWSIYSEWDSDMSDGLDQENHLSAEYDAETDADDTSESQGDVQHVAQQQQVDIYSVESLQKALLNTLNQLTDSRAETAKAKVDHDNVNAKVKISDSAAERLRAELEEIETNPVKATYRRRQRFRDNKNELRQRVQQLLDREQGLFKSKQVLAEKRIQLEMDRQATREELRFRASMHDRRVHDHYEEENAKPRTEAKLLEEQNFLMRIKEEEQEELLQHYENQSKTTNTFVSQGELTLLEEKLRSRESGLGSREEFISHDMAKLQDMKADINARAKEDRLSVKMDYSQLRGYAVSIKDSIVELEKQVEQNDREIEKIEESLDQREATMKVANPWDRLLFLIDELELATNTAQHMRFFQWVPAQILLKKHKLNILPEYLGTTILAETVAGQPEQVGTHREKLRSAGSSIALARLQKTREELVAFCASIDQKYRSM